MTITLLGLGLLSLLELMLYTNPVWRLRRSLAVGLMLGIGVVSGALLAQMLSLWVLLIVFINLYRLVNLLRIQESRVQADYLYHTGRRSSLYLLGAQVMVLLLGWLVQQTGSSVLSIVYFVISVLLIAAVVLLLTTLRHLKTIRPKHPVTGMASRELPSLTVAIPARNETADLEACLRTLVASTYPKLEILVLDDCSQDKRTPEIIRGFAHDGVRFLAGKPVPVGWLAKNHAYNQLADEANGEILLFCGVDVRFTPDSLTVLVKSLLQKDKSMVSILPANVLPQPRKLLALCIQPSRYAWELALPRRMAGRPAVLSTCWLITRAALDAAGGFAAVRRKIVPESYFARATSLAEDGYSFMRSDERIGLECVKTVDEQRDTAIRTRYPQLHRRPEMVALVSLAEFMLLVWPFIVVLAAILSHFWLLAGISAVVCMINLYTYGLIVNLTYRRFYWPGLFIQPIATLLDLGLLHYSMWQYEFGQVVWKGRDARFPTMRVIPSLPPLP